MERIMYRSAATTISLLLIGCSSGSSHPTAAAPTNPAAVSAALAPPPADCAGPRPTEVSTFGPGIGGLIAWAVGFGGPEATLHVGNGPRSTYGWRAKVLLVVDGSQLAPVTVTGRSDAGAPLWFEISGNAPSAPTKSPRLGPSAVPPVHGWKQYPAYFYVARAGCYTLRASWPGDGWAVRFAAGK